MGQVCFDEGDLPRMLAQGVTGIHACSGGPGCSMQHDHSSAVAVPRLRDGGPVSSVLFNPVTKPAWKLASKVMPEAITPVAAIATVGDEMLSGGGDD